MVVAVKRRPRAAIKKSRPVLRKKATTVVASRRRTRILAGVSKLVSHSKYKIKNRNPVVARGAPNPWAPKYTWAPWGTKGVVHDNCYDYAFGSFSNKRTSKSVPGDRSGNKANGLTFTTCNGIARRVLSDNPGNVYKMKTASEKPRNGFYKVMCFVAPTNDFGNSTGDFHWYKEISAIRYRIRPGDSAEALAKFFHVTKATIQKALATGRNSANANNGRVANDNEELRVLNKHVKSSNGVRLPAGKVIEFPVKLWSHKTGWAGGPLIVDASGKTIIDPRKADRNYTPGFHYTRFCSAYGVRRGFAKTGNNRNR
jgi:hypothetical protein